MLILQMIVEYEVDKDDVDEDDGDEDKDGDDNFLRSSFLMISAKAKIPLLLQSLLTLLRLHYNAKMLI